MPGVERFGVSMEQEMLEQFDSIVESRGYQSRSEAIRDLVRQEMVRQEWSDPSAEVVGTITIVYEHHEHELSNTLADLQHQFHQSILCSTHIHLDAHNCLEVIIVRGESAKVTFIANSLMATRGVKHGQLVSTTTGSNVT